MFPSTFINTGVVAIGSINQIRETLNKEVPLKERIFFLAKTFRDDYPYILSGFCADLGYPITGFVISGLISRGTNIFFYQGQVDPKDYPYQNCSTIEKIAAFIMESFNESAIFFALSIFIDRKIGIHIIDESTQEIYCAIYLLSKQIGAINLHNVFRQTFLRPLFFSSLEWISKNSSSK